MAGNADDPVGPNEFPGLGIGCVRLADMRAVRAEFRREVGPVVDEEGDIARLHKRHQDFGCTADGVRFRRCLVLALETKLQAGDVARVERHLQRVGEGARLEAGRGDEIEAAGLACFFVGHGDVLAR